MSSAGRSTQLPAHIRLTDKTIGKGSFGNVVLAQNLGSPGSPSDKKWLAVKQIDKRKLSQRVLQCIWNEIDLMEKICHPNIIKLTAVADYPDRIDLVLEYCDLGDLSQFIQTHRCKNHLEGIPVSFIYSFLKQIANSLQQLRLLNLVHRDLKPQNLMLCSSADGSITLKLGDFGFARELPGEDMAVTLCGSPLYMAPEILRYEKYDAKADLWSVGVILYEMITGKTPFRARNHIALLKKIQMTKRVLFSDETIQSPAFKEPSTSCPISIPSSRIHVAEHASTFAPCRIMSTDGAAKTPSAVKENQHYIDQDLRELTRSLLKKDPVERIGFEEFFLHDCVNCYPNQPHLISESLPQHKGALTATSSGPVSLKPIFMHHQYSGSCSNSSPLSTISPKLPMTPTTIPEDHIVKHFDADNNQIVVRIKRHESDSSITSSSTKSIGAPFAMDDVDNQQKGRSRLNSRSDMSTSSRRPSTGSQCGQARMTIKIDKSIMNLPFADPKILSASFGSAENVREAGNMQVVTSSSLQKNQTMLEYVAQQLSILGRSRSNSIASSVAQSPRQPEQPRENWDEVADGEYIIINRKLNQ